MGFKGAKVGVAQVANAPERVEELILEISADLQRGKLSRKDGERSRGRLQFANAQIVCVPRFDGLWATDHVRQKSFAADHYRCLEVFKFCLGVQASEKNVSRLS